MNTEKIDARAAQDAKAAILHLVDEGLLIRIQAFGREYILVTQHARDVRSRPEDVRDLALAKLSENAVIWLVDDPVIELDNLVASYNDTNRVVARMIGEEA